jgi:hypothetical protein
LDPQGFNSLINKEYFTNHAVDNSINIGTSPLYNHKDAINYSALLSISQHSQGGQDDSELMGIMNHKSRTHNFSGRKLQAIAQEYSGKKLEFGGGQVSGIKNVFTPSYLQAKDEPSFIETFRRQEEAP